MIPSTASPSAHVAPSHTQEQNASKAGDPPKLPLVPVQDDRSLLPVYANKESALHRLVTSSHAPFPLKQLPTKLQISLLRYLPKLNEGTQTDVSVFKAIVAEAQGREFPLSDADFVNVIRILIPGIALIEDGKARIECFGLVKKMAENTKDHLAKTETVIAGGQLRSTVPKEDLAGFDESLHAMARQLCSDPATAQKLIDAGFETKEFSSIDPAMPMHHSSFADADTETGLGDWIDVGPETKEFSSIDPAMPAHRPSFANTETEIGLADWIDVGPETKEFSLIVPAMLMHRPSFADTKAEIGFAESLVGLMKKIRGEGEKMEFFKGVTLTIIAVHKKFPNAEAPLFFQSDEAALCFIKGLEEMLDGAQTSRMVALATINTACIGLLKEGKLKTDFIFTLLERVRKMRDPATIPVVEMLKGAIPEGRERELFENKIAQMKDEMKNGAITQ